MHVPHLSATAFLIAFSAILVTTGCSKKEPEPMVGDGSDIITPQDFYEDGIPLTGQPFDEAYQPVTDAEASAIGPIYFGYDSSLLPPEEMAKIDAAAGYLNRNPQCVLIVEGHCDERGSNEYNLALGEQRALAVRSYLVNSGISADRIQSRSFGEERPAVIGHDESAWRMNRRGEFAFYR